jgi:glycosyltransferase involved in cell wall biosynthesis
MRVAIYYPWVYLKGGIERTILELKKRSRHEWTIFTSYYDRDETYPELELMDIRQLQRVSVKRTYLSVIRSAIRILRTRIEAESFDAVVICCDGIGSLLSFRNAVNPLICLCFTPLRAVYDEEYRVRHLSRYRAVMPLVLLLEVFYKAIDRLAWKKYRHVFCISRTVKERVLRGRLCSSDQVEIASPGIDKNKIMFSRRRDRYFFLPGRITWTKNIELGIRAFLEFKLRADGDFRLVIAGMVDNKSRGYYRYLIRLVEGREDVVFVRGPTDKQMAELYKNCYAVLFPSFNEDFGLVPIEAMSHGKPVVAVNRGGPAEVLVHGETGWLVDGRVNNFSTAMEYLVKNPSLAWKMGKNAIKRCELFTWDNFVERIDGFLDRLARKKCGLI